VTHRDLSVGYQAVQSTHAALEFVLNFPEIAQDWNQSKYLVQVTVPSKNDLEAFRDTLDFHGLKYYAFHEPDLGDELTALCIEPNPLTLKLIKKLKLL